MIGYSFWKIPYFVVLNVTERHRHIGVPYCELEMKENFKYLIHFLFVLDLNKIAKSDYTSFLVATVSADNGNLDFSLANDICFISNSDFDLLTKERKYCINRYKDITFRKNLFITHDTEWGVPYINVERKKLFDEELCLGLSSFLGYAQREERLSSLSFIDEIIPGLAVYNIVPLNTKNKYLTADFTSSYTPSFDVIHTKQNSSKQSFIFSSSYSECLNTLLNKDLLQSLVIKKRREEYEEQKRNIDYEVEKYMRRGWQSDYYDAMGGNMGD